MADLPGALAPGAAIAFVGLGRMGTPMTRRLLAAGYDVRGWDLDAAARRSLADGSGREEPASAEAALAGADALVMMLPDSRAVRAIVTAEGLLDALPRGALVLDMGSSDPMQTRELAEQVMEEGLAFVDAPVSGGVSGAEAGSLTIMVGGDEAAVTRCRPLLETLGSSIVHVGAVGAGHALKALNNLLSATHLLASVEAVRVGRRFGLDPETMVAAINDSTGRSWSTESKLPRFVLPETYDAGFALRLMNKDVQIAVGLAHATETAAPLAEAAAALWERAASELPADADHTEIARWVEALIV
jgi:3-hydroxyisobutyrate dehydrogenase